MRQIRKLVLFVVGSTTTWVVLIIASLLSACGKPSPTHQPEQVSVTFGCLSSQVTVYRMLANQFQQLHPEISVHIRETDDIFEGMDPANPTFALRDLAGQADAFAWFNMGLDQAARLGLLLDLEPLLEENVKDDFFPSTLEAFRHHDGLWGLPAYADPLMVFYNQTAFDQLDIAYPQIGWRWQDFDSLTEQLILRENVQVSRYGLVDVGDYLPLALVYQHGGSLTQHEPESVLMVPSLENTQAAEALDWYLTLARRPGVMSDPLGSDGEDIYDLIRNGRAAMWVAHLSSVEVWRTSEELSSIGVAPLPEDQVAAHPLLVSGYAVSGGTSHPQAAWRWIEYLTRQPAPSLVGQMAVPVRQSVAELESYWAGWEDSAPAIRYALTHALVEPGLWELWQIVGPTTPLVRGEKSIEEFLTEAQQRAVDWQADRAAIKSQPVAVAPSAPQPQERQKTIIFGIQSETQQAHYGTLAEAFMQSHPDIQIEVKDVTSGQSSVDLNWMIDHADVFLWDFLAFVDPDDPVVLDLTPLIEVDPDFSTEDYVPWVQMPERGGRTWGLPVTLDVQVIYYDRTAFEEVGIAYPDPNWSWDDLLTYATQLTRGDESDKRYGFLSWVWFPWDIYLYLESHNVHLMQRQDGRTVFYFDTDAVKRAVRWWVDLDRVYGAVPPLTNQPGQRNYDLLRARRVAMWSDWASNRDAPWLYEADRQLGVLPTPRGERSVARISLQFAYISPHSKQPKVCWQWIRYLSEHLPPGHMAPVRTLLLNSPAFKQQVGEEMAIAYLKALEADTRLGLEDFSQGGPFLVWLQEAVLSVAQGTDVDVALGEAQEKAQKYLEGINP